MAHFILSNVYIGKHKVLSYDEMTAQLDNGTMYIFSAGEFDKFWETYELFVQSPPDNKNMFKTIQQHGFTFMDERQTLGDAHG